MFVEEKIINKAEKYYEVGKCIPDTGLMNWNHRVIKGLSDMMLAAIYRSNIPVVDRERLCDELLSAPISKLIY